MSAGIPINSSDWDNRHRRPSPMQSTARVWNSCAFHRTKDVPAHRRGHGSQELHPAAPLQGRRHQRHRPLGQHAHPRRARQQPLRCGAAAGGQGWPAQARVRGGDGQRAGH
eukprot:3444466-Pleurochrysis_carterae.AAC.1